MNNHSPYLQVEGRISAMATISETKLFVGRLPADARIEEVEDVFGAFGKIVKLGES